MEIWLVIVGVMLAAALVAAAGGFRSRRTGVAARPVRRRPAAVVETPVERVVERRVE